jgi:hypothetical protein
MRLSLKDERSMGNQAAKLEECRMPAECCCLPGFEHEIGDLRKWKAMVKCHADKS